MMKLQRQKHKPGSLLIRFGDYRKGEPQVTLDVQKWHNSGRPEEVEVIFIRQKKKANSLK